DPWHTRSGWYEQRKREVLLAALSSPRYTNTFEPGCGDGSLTQLLASRSDHVLGMDTRRDLVVAASNRTSHLSNVTVIRGELPAEWPRNTRFDLVVLHEIGLCCDSAAWANIAEFARSSLSSDGTVVACHWKHPRPDQQLPAETLHGLLNSILGLPRQTKI